MIWVRRFHKWIGLAIGVQIGLWMVSGLMMSLLDQDKVRGADHRSVSPTALIRGGSADLLEPHQVVESARISGYLTSVSLVSLLGRRYYRATTADGVELFDAENGSPFELDSTRAADIAMRDYAGTAELASVSRVEAPTREVRRHEGPVWRANFRDDANTSIYISAKDGTILERRNDTWRLFDLFWMLHIMDYAERENFNNPLIIVIGLSAAFFSLSGILLLVNSFQKEDFYLFRPGARSANRRLTVTRLSGDVMARVEALSGQRLYDALAGSGIVLPSDCGGGGTCGLCEVTIGPGAPVSDADRRLISEGRLSTGVRLACQARVGEGGTVRVSRGTLETRPRTVTVASARCLTPFIREIVLDVDAPPIEYRAGSYIDVLIPPHRTVLDELDVPADARQAWMPEARGLVASAGASVRRAYSLATAALDNPGQLVLNVRLMLPAAGATDAPAGIGSAYMWSLRPGDTLEILEPRGEFHADSGESDMIVIGGGAGMAPLRAIIRDQLLHRKTRRRINFWYGARTSADLFYVAELDRLQASHENFSWQPVLSEPLRTDEWNGPVGFVHQAACEALLRDRADLARCEYFVCGPPAMLAATRNALAHLGVSEDRVHFDDFGI